MSIARGSSLCVLVAALCAGCGGSEDQPTGSSDDTFTLAVGAAAPSTYSDAAPNVSISAMTTVTPSVQVRLGFTDGTPLIFTVTIPTPYPSAPFPKTAAASFQQIAGGVVCTGTGSLTVTRFDGQLLGKVEGSFTSVTLTCPGPSTIQVSGGFSATRI